MKILVLGAGGMLGHKMVETLSNADMNVFASIRSQKSFYESLPFFEKAQFSPTLDVSDQNSLTSELTKLKPDVIINCIGVTTRKMSSEDIRNTVYINAMLPHLIDQWCESHDAYQIHFSTDCVFDGKQGFPYNENSPKTASDLYGQSKSLGEVTHSQYTLTLRTSIVGREIRHFTELIEWFLSQKNQTIEGYSNVIYSGLTTNAVSDIVRDLLQSNKKHSGLFQLSSKPISKFDLLHQLNKTFNSGCTIVSNPKMISNKTLSSDFFTSQTGYNIPSWEQMILDLHKDDHSYKNINLKLAV